MKTARALIVVGFVLGSVLGVLGQPGPLGNLSVNIVDGNGDPIREGTVLQASVRTNGYTIEGHGPFQDSWYKPRDARRSSFIGEIACGREVSVAVSAPGYRPKLVTQVTTTCPAEMDVVLEPDGSPFPDLKKLSKISVTFTGLARGTYDGALTIRQERLTYIPKISTQGRSSVELLPGTYSIEFSTTNCSQYSVSNYRVSPAPRTLTIDANCVQ